MTIAYLGPRGSFSEVAALAFDASGETVPCGNFPEIVTTVERGERELRHPPGRKFDRRRNQHQSRSPHPRNRSPHLRGGDRAGTAFSDRAARGIACRRSPVVSSHPQALAQCRHWLDRPSARCKHRGCAEHLGGGGNGDAWRRSHRGRDRHRAGGRSLRRRGDRAGYSRCSRQCHPVRGASTPKTPRRPATTKPTSPLPSSRTSLARSIARSSVFAADGIQLTKIESRPTKAWLGDYVFLLDSKVTGSTRRKSPARSRRPSEACDWVKVFGSYPRFPMESLRGFIEVEDRRRGMRMGLDTA